MKLNQLALLTLSGAMVAGCIYVPLGKIPHLTAGTLAAAGKVTLTVTPQVGVGSYSTQAVVNLYTQGDVNHLVLTLFKVDGASESEMVDPTGTPIFKDIPHGSMSAPVSFTNLHPNTTYRLRAFAYQATGTASADVISEDASSSLVVKVLTDDKPTAADFPIKLKDRPFHGEATSSFQFIPGVYVTEPEGFR